MLQSWKGRFGLKVEPVVLFWVEPGTIWWTRTLSEGGMFVASLSDLFGHRSVP